MTINDLDRLLDDPPKPAAGPALIRLDRRRGIWDAYGPTWVDAGPRYASPEPLRREWSHVLFALAAIGIVLWMGISMLAAVLHAL